MGYGISVVTDVHQEATAGLGEREIQLLTNLEVPVDH